MMIPPGRTNKNSVASARGYRYSVASEYAARKYARGAIATAGIRDVTKIKHRSNNDSRIKIIKTTKPTYSHYRPIGNFVEGYIPHIKWSYLRNLK